MTLGTGRLQRPATAAHQVAPRNLPRRLVRPAARFRSGPRRRELAGPERHGMLFSAAGRQAESTPNAGFSGQWPSATTPWSGTLLGSMTRRALILGDRYQSFYYPEVARACGHYVDAVSTNLNAPWSDGSFARFLSRDTPAVDRKADSDRRVLHGCAREPQRQPEQPRRLPGGRNARRTGRRISHHTHGALRTRMSSAPTGSSIMTSRRTAVSTARTSISA